MTAEEILASLSGPASAREDALVDRLTDILNLHTKGEGPAGMTTGYCSECEIRWPCPTAHIALGHGDLEPCEEAGFCSHVGEKI